MAAERPVVRPGDAGNESGRRDALGWEFCFMSEKPDGLANQPSRAEIADESDEVAAVGIKQAERRGIALAAGRVAVVAEHLEREHRAHTLAVFARAFRPSEAAHLVAEEVRHLLIGEGYEAYRQLHCR